NKAPDQPGRAPGVAAQGHQQSALPPPISTAVAQTVQRPARAEGRLLIQVTDVIEERLHLVHGRAVRRGQLAGLGEDFLVVALDTRRGPEGGAFHGGAIDLAGPGLHCGRPPPPAGHTAVGCGQPGGLCSPPRGTAARHHRCSGRPVRRPCVPRYCSCLLWKRSSAMCGWRKSGGSTMLSAASLAVSSPAATRVTCQVFTPPWPLRSGLSACCRPTISVMEIAIKQSAMKTLIHVLFMQPPPGMRRLLLPLSTSSALDVPSTRRVQSVA